MNPTTLGDVWIGVTRPSFLKCDRDICAPECPLGGEETKPMKRAAKHIVIKFTVGQGITSEAFRLRVGGEIERQHRNTDELGETTMSWFRMAGEPRGLPAKSRLLELALAKAFADLPPREGVMLYPDGIMCVGGSGEAFTPGDNGGPVIVISLGSVAP